MLELPAAKPKDQPSHPHRPMQTDRRLADLVGSAFVSQTQYRRLQARRTWSILSAVLAPSPAVRTAKETMGTTTHDTRPNRLVMTRARDNDERRSDDKGCGDDDHVDQGVHAECLGLFLHCVSSQQISRSEVGQLTRSTPMNPIGCRSATARQHIAKM